MADEKETKEKETEEEVKEEEAKEEKKAEDDKKEEKEEKKEEETKEEKDEEDEEEEVEVPAEFEDLIETIENMTVLELNKLVKVIEKKFGVSAQAVAVAGAGAGDAGAAEEKDEFTVELASAGDSKIGVIKAVKAALGLGLKEAKDLVEDAPAVLKENVKKEEAEEMKTAIEEAGGTVELK